MVKIIFTRHGQTKWNIEKRCQGQRDTELTDNGLSQAKDLAQRLKNIELDIVYTSDLKRAVDTALEIKKLHDSTIDIIKEPLLREYSFGIWEGLTNDEIKEQYKELAEQRKVTPDIEIPQAEKYQDLVYRGVSFIEHCLKNHQGKTVLAVTHSGFIKALLHQYLELPWKIVKNNLYLGNCSLTILKVTKEKVVIETINDTAHFESLRDMVEARH